MAHLETLPPLATIKLGHWQHYLGGIYVVTGTRRFEPRPEITLVEYHDTKTGEKWARPAYDVTMPDGIVWSGFLGVVKVPGEGAVPRFKFLDESQGPIRPEDFGFPPEVWQVAKWQNLQKQGIQREQAGTPILYKRLRLEAYVPEHGQEGDAGADFRALEDTVIPARGRALVPTGIAVAIPAGHYGHMQSRSGLSLKEGIEVGAGTIDSRFRGSVGVVLYNHTDQDYQVRRGDKVSQMVVQAYCRQRYVLVDDLPPSDRTRGWGSTGR